MMKPKVSVIVPIYNVEKYLNCCVDSLLNQTLTDLEIILVDDGSPDRCPEICDGYAKQDHRVKVIHKKNAGQGYARNTGIGTATGEYIAFVDSDDYLAKDAYEKLYHKAKGTKADVVYFTYQRFDNDGNVLEKPSNCREILYQTEEDVRRLMLDFIANPPKAKTDLDIVCSSCCALYRHSVIQANEVRFKSERELISEDRLFNLDFLLHAETVALTSDAYYNYRINPLSFRHTVKPDIIEKNYFYYQYLLKMLAANNFGINGYLRATRLFIGFSRGFIRQFLQSPLPQNKKKQWLKEVSCHPVWREIATAYPYRQLPFLYVLHFWFLFKGHSHCLYFYSKLWSRLKSEDAF